MIRFSAIANGTDATATGARARANGTNATATGAVRDLEVRAGPGGTEELYMCGT